MTGKALICKLTNLSLIGGADNIQQASLFGETIIISKDHKEGEIGLLFDCETELSHEFCKANNLYRKPELNSDKTKTGFFEENRRVRPIKLRGVKCSGFWIPIESLEFIVDLSKSSPEEYLGQEVDEIMNVKICQKYITQKTRESRGQNKGGKAKENLCPTFKEHIDTDQALRNLHLIQEGNLVIITEKLHGTSGRCGSLPVQKSVPLWWTVGLFLASKFTKWITKTEDYDFVVGSRRVVKRIGDEGTKSKINWDRLEFSGRKDQVNSFLKTNLKESDYELYRKVFPETSKPKEITLDHVDQFIPGFKEYFTMKDSGYYDTDIWSLASEQFKGKLYKGETIYFEIVGYLPNGTPIMGTQSNTKLEKFMEKQEYKDFLARYGTTTEFSYGCKQGEHKVFVYRITMTNEDGESFDLSWDQVKRRCEKLGVDSVPEIERFILNSYHTKNRTIRVDEKLDLDFSIETKIDDLTNKDSEHFKQHLKEGIIVRVENGANTPVFLKNKNYYFKVLEGIVKDSNTVDLEESQG